MQLSDFLFESGMSPADLRRILGIKSRETVWRYLTKRRIPQPQHIQRIIEISRGKVQLADFLDPNPPKCAKLIIDAEGRERMVLPWSKDWPEETPLKSPDGTEGLSAPVKRAFAALEGRATYARQSGTFLLDGRAVDLRRIITAANEVLQAKGELTIVYPGAEPLL